MQIIGRLTNQSSYTPPVSQENPNPRTFNSIEIEGCRVGLPSGFAQPVPPIGTTVFVEVIAKQGQKGLSLTVVNVPNAIAKTEA